MFHSNSQANTSSYCYSKDIDDMNETIELEHDIEGLEEILSLPRNILEALNKESEGSKPNIEEKEMINLPTKARMKNLSRWGKTFLKIRSMSS